MFKKTTLVILLAFSACAGAVIWYGGDFDGVNGSANEVGSLIGTAKTYDDFAVTGDGWIVTDVWSNNLLDSMSPSMAEVEIRSGVSAGNGGTMLFSGAFSAASSATGRSGFGMSEHEIRITGLDVYLPPGTYHLSVAPVGSNSGRSFVSTTSGANSSGAPIGNGNSFINSADLDFDWEPTTAALGPGTWDFSMGVDAFQVVNPSTVSVFRGILVSGSLSSLFLSDDDRFVVRPGLVLSSAEAPVQIVLTATAPATSASELRFILEASATVTNIRQELDLFNFVSGAYEEMDSRAATTADTRIQVSVTTNPSRFIHPQSGEVRARIRYRQTGPVISFPWSGRVDQAVWAIR